MSLILLLSADGFNGYVLIISLGIQSSLNLFHSTLAGHFPSTSLMTRREIQTAIYAMPRSIIQRLELGCLESTKIEFQLPHVAYEKRGRGCLGYIGK